MSKSDQELMDDAQKLGRFIAAAKKALISIAVGLDHRHWLTIEEGLRQLQEAIDEVDPLRRKS